MDALDPVAHWRTPVRLSGTHVCLEPLALAHVPGLQQAAGDGALWRLWYTSVPHPDETRAYVEKALAAQDAGTALPFVVRNALGDIVGSTRLGNIDIDNRRVEIGWTWYAASAQRTALNTEAKWLLLGHAFETMRAAAVELRTSWMNQRSRTAIARLGAKQDGVLRNHMRLGDGAYRDTVVFSIIESEWPAVRRHLRFLMDRQGSGA